MKNLILVFAVIAIMMLLPLTVVYAEENNSDSGNNFRTRFANWKEIQTNLREKFLQNQNFRENLKGQINDCFGKNSTECKGVRENATEVVKGVMQKVCEKSDEKLNDLKNRIENNEKLTAEEKDALNQAIDDQKSEIDDICSKIDDANATELKDLSKDLKRSIVETRVKFEIARGLVYGHRVGLIIERAEHLEKRLDKIAENATECDIKDLTDQFDAKITDARIDYNASVDFWQQFKETVKNHDPDAELLRQAQEKLHAAVLDLKDAHSTLKDIIVKLRECKHIGDVELPIEPIENQTAQ